MPRRDLLLHAVPGLEIAASFANLLRQDLGPHRLDRGRSGLARLCIDLQVRIQVVQAQSIVGGQSATLLPGGDGWFDLIIPMAKAPVDVSRAVARNGPIRFAVAHEIAHTLFYDRAVTPARRTCAWSLNEEAFCDQFAMALLGHSTSDWISETSTFARGFT